MRRVERRGPPAWIVLLATLVATGGTGCDAAAPTSVRTDGETPAPSGGLPVVRAGPERTFEIVTRVERDAIAAIDRPAFWTADEADRGYRPDEPVVGVVLGGAARAYSLPFLSRHETVNDSVGGVPVVVTWCPLTYTARVFRRPTIDGVELDFGVSGKLIHNNLVLYDRQTDSLWSQMLGEAVYGGLRGQELEPVASLHTSWSSWRQLHPETDALRRSGSRFDPYDSYYAGPQAGAFGEDRRDDRLPRKAQVLGVHVDGSTVAFPLDALGASVVTNERVGERGVLLVADLDTGTAAAFRRSVDERDLTFEVASGGGLGLVLRDSETGSMWRAWTGEAFEGSMSGRRLEHEPAVRAFWFAWKDFHPDTEVRATPDEMVGARVAAGARDVHRGKIGRRAETPRRRAQAAARRRPDRTASRPLECAR